MEHSLDREVKPQEISGLRWITYPLASVGEWLVFIRSCTVVILYHIVPRNRLAQYLKDYQQQCI